jgi:hypothetical protein
MDEPNEFQQLGNLTFEVWGRVGGLDMMLRSLLAKWAQEHDDPQTFLDELERELINGMAQQGRDDDPVEATLIPHAEAQIRDTVANAKLRASLGSRD